MQAIGNDVIDLHHPSILEHSAIFQGGDEEWMQRHLTSDEWRWLQCFSNPQQKSQAFWQIFVLKEASSKAITQLGYTVPIGSFTHFEANFARNVVFHCSGEVLFVQNIRMNPKWIHAVVTSTPPSTDFKIIWEVHHLKEGSNASEYLQKRLLQSLKCHGYSSTTYAQKEGIPLAIQEGKSVTPVSFSHSGRFAAFSWMLQKV